LKGSGSFQHITYIFSRLQDVLEEQARGKLTEAKLTGHKRRVVKLIGWRIAWDGGTFNHFATTVTKFGWENARFNKGIEDRSRYLIRIVGFKSEFEWKSQFIILIIR